MSISLSTLEAYAGKGRCVFPVYGLRGRTCDCGKRECPHPGKHPIPFEGLNSATTDVLTIRGWYTRYRNANWAVRTGVESGIVVVDVDTKHNGEAMLSFLQELYGPLVAGRKAKTGSGGSHNYFR